MLKASTPTVIELLNSCLIETSSTRKTQILQWPSSLPFVMLKSNSSLVSVEELQNKIVLEAEKFPDSEILIKRAVTVRMMRLKWFTKLKEV